MTKKNSKTKRVRGVSVAHTIGIDLGDRTSRYCQLNREGEKIEEGSFATRGQRNTGSMTLTPEVEDN